MLHDDDDGFGGVSGIILTYLFIIHLTFLRIFLIRFYSRATLCGISAIRKKKPHKIYVGASNEAYKI